MFATTLCLAVAALMLAATVNQQLFARWLEPSLIREYQWRTRLPGAPRSTQAVFVRRRRRVLIAGGALFLVVGVGGVVALL